MKNVYKKNIASVYKIAWSNSGNQFSDSGFHNNLCALFVLQLYSQGWKVNTIYGCHSPRRIHLSHKINFPCIAPLVKENWIQGGGDKVRTLCWRTSFCVTTIIKTVNNNTNDKQSSGASLAVDEDSPYTISCLFTLDRLPLLLLLRKN